MADQKKENQLNLALDASEEDRKKSQNLQVGYDPDERSWDLIIRYSGDLSPLREKNISAVELSGNYAILTVPESLIDTLATIPQIEYIEKPKRLFFTVSTGKSVSCINPVQDARLNLLGEGVIIGIIDSGIDYSHPDFRNEDGTTRILELWDQTIPGNPPKGYQIGTVYTKDQINEALKKTSLQEQQQIVPSQDLSGHGTHVAGIAAGNGRASNGQNRGVAPKSDLIIVKLGNPKPDSFPRTTELMQAIDYVVKKGVEYGKPLALNLSFGNTYGSHDGTSLIETFIDNIALQGRTTIIAGTGNEGAAAGHTSGVIKNDVPEEIELAISNYETNLSLQIWKSFVDEFDIEIEDPSGQKVGPIQKILGPQQFRMGDTKILLYYGEPSPYSRFQEIYIEFIPAVDYIDDGIWKIRLIPENIVKGQYDMWLPSAGAMNPGTRFLLPNPVTTLTIPSTANRVITVGAYDPVISSYADFSGRGYTRETNLVKPDIVAPGVNITSAAPGGGYTTKSGTSMATPFVTGAAALLMEWGIIDKNDPSLYGEKVKAFLQRGAKHLPVETVYPNPTLGYGALCVRDSLIR